MAHISKKSGHAYAWDPVKKQSRMEHVIKWEKRTGRTKPKNMVLHHKDHGKTDGSARNIVLVDRSTHGLLHAGAQFRGGVLKKQCTDCRAWLNPDDFYGKRTSRCRPCYNKHTEKLRKQRSG